MPPTKPATPSKVMAKSTTTSIFVTWTQAAATQVPILGYKLFLSAGTSQYTLVYNNTRNPLITEYNITGLMTGQVYQITLVAVNFNGDSQMSDPLVKYSCVEPSMPSPPVRVTGDRTDLTLSWLIPKNDGGCPLTGFNLYRDNGAGGSISIEVDPLAIDSRPSLTQHNLVFLPADTGKLFRF